MFFKKKSYSRSKERQTQYLSQAIQLEEAVNPHIVRTTMSIVSLAILAFLVWAGFTNINEVARTSGEVVPQGYQQTVQHFEGGIINAIHVQEGDVVRKGQKLITLDKIGVGDDLSLMEKKQNTLKMQAERLRAYVEDRDPDLSQFNEVHASDIADQKIFFESMRDARLQESGIVQKQIEEKQVAIASIQSDIETLRSGLEISQDVYDRRKILNEKGYATDMQLLEDRKIISDAKGKLDKLQNQIRVANAEIRQFKNRLQSLNASQKDTAYERLDIVNAEISQNAEIIDKLRERILRTEIISPSDGLVKGLAVNTVGAVVQPAQKLMEIVPIDKTLEVLVKISPKDIGHLHVGQDVQLKFSSYDFSRYGSLKGELAHISATTFKGDDGQRFYQGRVNLGKNYVGSNPANIVMPGMTVMADVITGRKTILQYLIRPIHISLRTAFTER